MITIPCAGMVEMTAALPLTHRCPFREETDRGSVTLAWRTAGSTLELHALAVWLDGYADAKLSHEDVTADICDRLAAQDGIGDVRVTTRWNTAGAEVTVDAVSGERLDPGST